MKGNTEPRLWTKPLRPLDRTTSYGYRVIDFARDVLGEPLDPWQEWVVIHAGELLPNGKPRFRRVLILVARQNGKTHLLKVLALFWLFVEQWPMVLGTSHNLEYAKEAWSKAVDAASSIPVLAQYMGTNAVLRGNNDVHMKTTEGCKYKIAAANRRGGRSLSIDRAIADELREQQDWDAYNAAYNAMNARPCAQYFGISNAGDDKSEVLNELRDLALGFINHGQGDKRLGLFEWSAVEGADVEDPEAWAAANPNLGYRIDVETIAGAAASAKQKAGKVESGFRTEVLCQHVKKLDAAVDPAKWSDSASEGTLDDCRGRVTLCLDISPDGQHATLAAAAQVSPGITRVEVVESWAGIGCIDKLRRDLPAWIEKVKPRTLGWFPNGPAAALTAELGKNRKPGWPPKNVVVSEIKGETTAVCMGFAEQVIAGRVIHPDDPLLNMHVLDAERLGREAGSWVFSRKGGGHCDAAYAAAGAVHLARTLPPAKKFSAPVASDVAIELSKRGSGDQHR